MSSKTSSKTTAHKAKSSVLIVTRTIPPDYGSPGRLARDLARMLAREGHSVTLLSTSQSPKPIVRKGHLRVVRLVQKRRTQGIFTTLWLILRLFRAAMKMPPHDVVITLTDPPMLLLIGGWLSRLRGSKHVHWVHQLYPDLFEISGVRLSAFWTSRLRVASRKAMKRADALVPVSRCMSRHLAHTGMETRKLHLIENWPDPELAGHGYEWLSEGLDAMTGKKPARELRAKEPIHKDHNDMKFRVLYAGTIGRTNPMETILGAAQILNSRHPEIEFVFVGKGKGFDRLAAYRAKHGLENIRILPPQPRFKLKALMESGDIHLVSLADEATGLTMPLKLYAALAVQRPVAFIGAQDCHVAGLVNKHHAGEVIAHGQAQKLASMIRNYRMDPSKWFAAHEGATAAAENRMPEVSLKHWVKLIKEV